MEERKEKEIEYYDKKAEKRFGEAKEQKVDFEGFEPDLLSSYDFCYKLLRGNCQNKIVLDYGCGNGVHTIPLAKMGAEKVVGIDLSEKSLDAAKERAKKERLEKKIELISMDCEKMEFPDNTFDIIFDGGTFSSLDIKKVYPELNRVLKPGGSLIGIETLGHNPFTNFKRKINKIVGKRTEWASEHIFRTEDLEKARAYFRKIEVNYFHLISWISFPFLKFSFGKYLLEFLEEIDKILMKIPFLRKYSFKVVFIFSKNDKKNF